MLTNFRKDGTILLRIIKLIQSLTHHGYLNPNEGSFYLKKVLFVVGTPWASGYYRMSQAANQLTSMGYPVETVMYTNIDPLELKAGERTLPTGHLSSTDFRVIDLLEFDTIIFQIVLEVAMLYVIDALNAKGKRTILEIDDDYFSLPRDNPSWISFHPKIKMEKRDGMWWGVKYKGKVNTKLDVLRQACRAAHELQVSTPELAEVYGRLNSNVTVIENCVENQLYDEVPKRVNSKPVVGWFGTQTHKSDLEIVVGCFPPSDQFKLLIAGYQEAREAIFGSYPDVEVIPRPFEPTDIPSIVAKCDIGIVPLVQCRFNDGKSDLKGVEFGAGKVPVIASDGAPYRRWIRDGVNGYLCKKNKTKYWIRYIRRLVEDGELRTKMSGEAKKDALKRDVAMNINKRIKLYFA